MPKDSEINVSSSNLDVIVNAEQVVRGAAQAQQRNQELASRGGAREFFTFLILLLSSFSGINLEYR